MSKGFRAPPSLSRAQKVGKREKEEVKERKEGRLREVGRGEVRQPSRPQPEETGTGEGGGGRVVHVAFPPCSSQRGVEIHGYQHHRELDEEAVR